MIRYAMQLFNVVICVIAIAALYVWPTHGETIMVSYFSALIAANVGYFLGGYFVLKCR